MGASEKQKLETATFGGGCFWCIEPIFERLRGVANVLSGYSGGNTDRINYYLVSTGKTGHAEVIQIEFDPSIISYSTLLDIFFDFHDPTTPDQQGPDIGSEYRSIILYHSDQQKKVALQKLEEKEKDYTDKIITEIAPFEKFYTAEEYHQNFFDKNPDQFYCQVNIKPKITKLETKYKHLLK